MSSTRPRAVTVAGALAVVVLPTVLVVVTALAAAQAYGTSFPSLFVDPFGGYSIVLLPSWDAARMDIPVGSSVRALDDDADATLLPAERLSRASVRAAHGGASRIFVRIGDGADAHVVALTLRSIGQPEILLFYALYVLAGLLLLWSGAMVAIVAWNRAGGRAYLALAVVGFVFLVTFLDYQTTRWLAPLFAATTVGNSLAIFALAWWFPSAPQVSRGVRALAGLALALGLALSLTLALAAALHVDLHPLRDVANLLVPIALLALFASVGWRLRTTSEQGTRAELRSAAYGLALVPLVFGLTFVLSRATGELSIFHVALPFASVAVPAAIGNALMRHNALAVRGIVTQRLMSVPIVLIALAVGGACAAPFGSPEHWEEPALVALSVATSVGVLGWFGVGRLLTAAEGRFQPTLEGLAGEVAALRTPDAIRSRLGELVHRCLPLRVVHTATPGESDAIRLSATDRQRFLAGETVWTESVDESPASLAAPLRFGGEALGAIVISARPGDPLFIDGEVRVIQTIVSLGALALHHAELLREVEERRAIERGATRGDKRMAVDVVAAEIAHELAYPIGFLRHFLKQIMVGRTTPDMVDVGQEELDRLERMLAWVRKLQMPVPAMGQVRVRLVVTHVLMLLEGDFEARGLTCSVDVAADVCVNAEHDALLQLLANLLRNATQAARSKVGVRACVNDRGETELHVWDDGPGVSPELASRIFDPFFSTQAETEGHGFGLAVAQRVARGFGWVIEVRRDGDKTVFAVRVKRRAERATPLERVAS